MINHDSSCCGGSGKSSGGGSAVSNLFEGLTTLIGDTAQLSIELLQSLSDGIASLPSMSSMPSLSSLAKRSQGCSCEIPPACWLPVEAGRAESAACPGATATLRIRVTNCGMAERRIAIEAGGSPSGMTVHPPTLDVGALESATSVVSFAVPEDAPQHAEYPFMIWVRGCKTHYLRWTVVAGDGDCHCHTISIEDCPETVHHWYDHFYCEKPCQH